MKKKLYVISRKEKVSQSAMDLVSAFRNRVRPDYLISFYYESPDEKNESSFIVFDDSFRSNLLPFISIISSDPDKFSMLFSAVLASLNELFSVQYIDSDEASTILSDADR